MPEYVRVRDKETGHHYSVTRKRFDANPDLWQELKQPAVDEGDALLPPKHKTTVADQATGTKRASQPAAKYEKEN